MISDDADYLLKKNIEVLNGLFDRKQIDEGGYYKGLVCIAFEYAKQDALASAVVVLSTIPIGYYSNLQAAQLVSDSVYFGLAQELGAMLVERGLAGLESADVRPTQASAQA